MESKTSEMSAFLNEKALEMRREGKLSAIAVLAKKSGYNIDTPTVMQFIIGKIDVLFTGEETPPRALAQAVIPTKFEIDPDGTISQRAVASEEKGQSSVIKNIKSMLVDKLQTELNDKAQKTLDEITMPTQTIEVVEEIAEVPAEEVVTAQPAESELMAEPVTEATEPEKTSDAATDPSEMNVSASKEESVVPTQLSFF